MGNVPWVHRVRGYTEENGTKVKAYLRMNKNRQHENK